MKQQQKKKKKKKKERKKGNITPPTFHFQVNALRQCR